MSRVLGKNIVFSILIETTYYPVFCAKTLELSTEQEELEVTSINSGADREFIPALSSHMLSATGLTELDNNGGRLSIIFLLQQSVRRGIHNCRVVLTDIAGKVLVLSFNAFIRSTAISKQSGQLSTSGISMRISGAIAYSDVVPAPVDPICEIADPIYMTLAAGATSVTNALLTETGVEILGVWRYSSLRPTNGTPAGSEYRVDYTTGTVYFDPNNPGNPGGEPIHILYKIIA